MNSGNVSLQNTTGREVTVQAASPADAPFEIEAEIEGLTLNPKAVFTGTVLSSKTIPVTVWIVRKNDGTNPALDDYQLLDLFSGVNKIYSQVGMTFELIGPINHLNRSDWMNLTMTNSLSNLTVDALIGQQPNVSNGLELYFVQSVTDCSTSSNTSWDLGGFYLPNGIVIGREEGVYTPTARTIAHEIGHACGLSDIYIANGGMSVPPNMSVSVTGCPSDYGLYPSNLTQADVISRLLMYGISLDIAVTIPRGTVFGVGKSSPSVFTLLSVPVGLNTPLNRQPKSQ